MTPRMTHVNDINLLEYMFAFLILHTIGNNCGKQKITNIKERSMLIEQTFISFEPHYVLNFTLISMKT